MHILGRNRCALLNTVRNMSEEGTRGDNKRDSFYILRRPVFAPIVLAFLLGATSPKADDDAPPWQNAVRALVLLHPWSVGPAFTAHP